MAGMLPGVECARRRRLHQSGDSPSPGAHGWTRRSSFCLYTSNSERVSSLTYLEKNKRNISSNGNEDERLGVVVREAKERLDERLRSQRKIETRRQSKPERPRCAEGKSMASGELHTEVFGAKKSVSKRFSWAKLSWKATDQDVCTICLEQFHAGQTSVHLPCAHRYHPKCLVPWLENNAHCPCCRLEIRLEVS